MASLFTLANAARLGLAALSALLLFEAAPSILRDGGEARAEAAREPAPEAAQADAPAPPSERRRSTPRLDTVRVVRELSIPHWLRPGEYAWDAEAAARPGETVVVANLRARVLSVYRDGVEIGRSSLIYGADNKPTPHGVFPILEKRADHRSNLYDAPMPHMQRLTWDGVALHGSPELRDDLGTRGCIGLPREFAALLFGATRVGDRVIVWDGVTG